MRYLCRRALPWLFVVFQVFDHGVSIAHCPCRSLTESHFSLWMSETDKNSKGPQTVNQHERYLL